MTTPSFDIRPATDADISEMAALYRRAYDTLGDLGFPSSMQSEDGERLRDWLDTREMFVADTGDSLVGAVHLIPREAWPCPELGRLAVHPDYQESGVGTALREHIEATARNRGYDRLRLRTFTGHPFLKDWYERAGYEHVADQDLDTPHYDLHILEKEL